MADIRSVWLRQQFKLMKPLLKNRSLQTDRQAQDMLGALATRSFGDRVEYVPEPLSMCEADWAQSVSLSDADCPILYLHGGSYTAGSIAYARGFGGVLAEATSRRVLCLGYRLAPEAPYPAALDDAREAYLRMLDAGSDPARVIFAGESAGGGLVFCLLLDCAARGIPLPAAVIAISPWTDLTLAGESYTSNERVDPTLERDRLAYSANLYAAGRLEEPTVSPIFGEFFGMPPALVFAASDELLLDDAITLYKKYIAAGSTCTLHIEDGMWHVYPLFGVPEAKLAMERITAFCDLHVPMKPRQPEVIDLES